MKKVLIFLGLLLLCLFVGSVSAMSGNGDADNPWIITTPADLTALSGTGLAGYGANAYYELGADIDMSGVSFTPIGTTGGSYRFIGHFDGKNHTISNLSISLSSTGEVGLFSCIDTGANIANLRFYNADVSGDSHVGVLFGESYGIGVVVNNIRVVNSSVSGSNFVGGIVGCGAFGGGGSSGSNYTNLYCENVYVHGTHTVGGIFGGVSDNAYTKIITVSNCSIYNSVVSGSDVFVGGIAGVGSYRGEHIITDCIVQNCYISSDSSYVGGITTRFDGGSISYTPNTPQITNCSVNGCTLNGYSYIGGIYSVNLNGPDVVVTDCTVSECSIIGTSYVGGVGV